MHIKIDTYIHIHIYIYECISIYIYIKIHKNKFCSQVYICKARTYIQFAHKCIYVKQEQIYQYRI